MKNTQKEKSGIARTKQTRPETIRKRGFLINNKRTKTTINKISCGFIAI